MITFDDIKKANDTIMTTEIKGKDYAEVNQRIKAFRMVYPEGSISTEILILENGICTMKATVSNEGKVLGTGYAQEKEASSFINKTSYIENCETSAVGRALGMCGFGIDTSVCSADELKNALNNQTKDTKKPKYATEAQIAKLHKDYSGKEDKLEALLKKNKVDNLIFLPEKIATDVIAQIEAKQTKE